MASPLQIGFDYRGILVSLALLIMIFIPGFDRFLVLTLRLIDVSLTGNISRLNSPIKCIVVAFCLFLVTTQNAKPEFLDGQGPISGKPAVVRAVEMLRASLKRVPFEVKTALVAAKDKPVAAVLGVFDNCVPVLGTSITVDLFKRDCRTVVPGPFRWPAAGVPIIFTIVASASPPLALSICGGRSR